MNLLGVTGECDRLWSHGAMALIGISPFNSYFSLERIQAIVEFCARDERPVALFIPDDVTRFTLQARGYTAGDALRKTRRQIQYLRNKIDRAVDGRRVPVIGCAELESNSAYAQHHALFLQAFENDLPFREKCLDTTRWVLSAKEDEEVGMEAALLGVRYLLAELPLFFNAPVILGAREVVFVYHQCPDLIAGMYRQPTRPFVSPGQGFGVLSNQDARS
jgi:cyclo(L-tyrosyl-L-tyrosyl) synthase